MPNTTLQLEWEPKALKKFDDMIKRIPLFHRQIAYQVVQRKAPENAKARGATQVEEADIVRAFLCEVPHAFYSLMVRLLDEVGFKYQQYEVK